MSLKWVWSVVRDRQWLPPQIRPRRCPPGLMCHRPRQPPGWLAAITSDKTSSPHLLLLYIRHNLWLRGGKGEEEGEKDILFHSKTTFGTY